MAPFATTATPGRRLTEVDDRGGASVVHFDAAAQGSG